MSVEKRTAKVMDRLTDAIFAIVATGLIRIDFVEPVQVQLPNEAADVFGFERWIFGSQELTGELRISDEYHISCNVQPANCSCLTTAYDSPQLFRESFPLFE